MATINEDYVSFEVSKLLKEKGFDQNCGTYYLDGQVWRHYDGEVIPKGKQIYAAPTLQIACKWLRKKYNIVISVNPQKDKYCFVPWQLRDSEWVYVKALLPLYDKHEAACEAAIRYCLENLI